MRTLLVALCVASGVGVALPNAASAENNLSGWSCRLEMSDFSPNPGTSADGTATCFDPISQSVVAHAVHMAVESSTGGACTWTARGTITLDAPTGTYRDGFQLAAVVEGATLTIDSGAAGIVAFAPDRLARRCLTADPGYEVSAFSGVFGGNAAQVGRW